MFGRLTVAACSVLVAAAAFPASAACTIKVLPIPIAMKGLRPMVTAKINEQDVSFLLDSGSAINMISGQFAADHKLKPMGVNGIASRIADDGQSMGSGAAGTTMVNGVVLAQQVAFLGTVFKNVAFVTSPRLTGASGLIGQSLLHQTDVEYDLSGGVVRLVKPDGCSGTDMVYWTKPGTAYSKTGLDWSNPNDTHSRISITINGVKLLALLDTGADVSLITEKAAARAGVKSTDPGVVATGMGGGLDSNFQTWTGTFADMKIGDEELKNVRLNIGRSAADEFDILLGADFFMAHHVYVANSQQQVYFAYTGGTVFRTPPAKAPK
jgi:predicted aspartyl protease